MMHNHRLITFTVTDSFLVENLKTIAHCISTYNSCSTYLLVRGILFVLLVYANATCIHRSSPISR